MGGDDAPRSIVAGAVLAAEAGHRVVLVGREDAIRSHLPAGSAIDVVGADDVVTMDDDPVLAIRRKKGSSVHVAANLVKAGTADALLGFGNTGVTMGVALLRFGRLGSVRRPAIAAEIPTRFADRFTVLLDVGANVVATAPMLCQFAQLGAAYARVALGRAEPRVGLLNIGAEAGKGTDVVNEAAELLGGDSQPVGPGAQYVGFVEGGDLSTADVDVVVCDGYSGNIALKSIEGVARGLVDHLRTEMGDASHEGPVGEILERIDPNLQSGAILLGVRNVAVVGHGAAIPEAVASAVDRTARLTQAEIIEEMANQVGSG